MKLNSPLFDKIRVKPDKDRTVRKELPGCEWPGCGNGATHRAPKGRGRENEYLRFCLNHVREYNHSYNFFKDMPADAVADYQKDAQTGHRPTWKMGAMGGDRRKARLEQGEGPDGERVEDESHQHAGHAGHRGEGGETHFRVYIVTNAFKGKSRVDRHRMINQLLAAELAGGVHALAIHARTPEESSAA